ncbi:MAG: hypothetical protein QF886_22735, partial [Planctomycetota bacterium]|nr:hypothetical protein [Planctomycetota bacterium]
SFSESEYVLTEISGGSHTLVVSHPNFSSQEIPINIPWGESISLEDTILYLFDSYRPGSLGS